MAEGVSNNIQNIQLYNKEQVQNESTVEDDLSLFDGTPKEDAAEDLPVDEFHQSVDEGTNNYEEQVQNLTAELKSVEDEQGWFGRSWDSFKGLTGIGTSTKKCEQAIDDFKNGKISYEAAQKDIAEFSECQKESVEIAANVVSGVAAVGAATLATTAAVVSGPFAPLVIAGIGAGAGAVTKAGITFSDRATNNIDGDALNEKKIIKDLSTGAVEGAVATATMGIGTAALAAGTTLKEAVFEGVKAGSKAGIISGGVTGGSNYAIDTVLDDNAKFNGEDFAKSVISNSAAGLLTGGTLGVIGGKLHHQIYSKLEANSKEMFENFNAHIPEAEKQIKNEFSELIENKAVEVSARPKSEDSILKKLVRKADSHTLKSTEVGSCMEAIGDAYGTRIKMKSLSVDEANSIIQDKLDNYGIKLTAQDFTSFLKGDNSHLTASQIQALGDVQGDILNVLKETQSGDVVTKLIDSIRNKSISITELNNYGDELSSYLTARQAQEIAEAYKDATGKAITIVTKEDIIRDASGKKVAQQGQAQNYEEALIDSDAIKEVITKKAVKKSGYTSAQMNTKHNFNDGTTGNGELQIRGMSVNKLADVEHIPYDIRQGKITAKNKEYEQIYRIITNMNKDTYNKYNKFLTDTYRSMRLQELGISVETPDIHAVFNRGEIPDEAFDILSVEGLIKTAKQAKEYKKLHQMN